MSKIILDIRNIHMRFRLSREKITSLKDYILRALKGNLHYNEFYALKDVSFQVQKGDRVGILGLNGAGKSTLLKVIAGVYKPTSGTVIKRGKVIPLLELGAGFEKDYTGRENIFLYGSFLGYSKEFIESKFDEIVSFAELEKFIDVPVTNYSSGMRARLGFAIATVVEPEILIVDEVLAVGDAAFQEKSRKRMMELMSGGTTVLFVSHDLSQIRTMCNRVVWIDHGTVKMFGPTQEVCDAYQNSLA